MHFHRRLSKAMSGSVRDLQIYNVLSHRGSDPGTASSAVDHILHEAGTARWTDAEDLEQIGDLRHAAAELDRMLDAGARAQEWTLDFAWCNGGPQDKVRSLTFTGAHGGDDSAERIRMLVSRCLAGHARSVRLTAGDQSARIDMSEAVEILLERFTEDGMGSMTRALREAWSLRNAA